VGAREQPAEELLGHLHSQWLDVAKLPRACSHDHSGGNVLCPFGFIGLRYAIEQLSSTDKPGLTIASAPRCDFAVAKTQYQLPDPKALEKHVAALGALGAGPTGVSGTLCKFDPRH
jgi:hypothetical protein